MRRTLEQGPCPRLKGLADEVRNVRLLERGMQLRQGLSQDWRNNGAYANALAITQRAFVQEHFSTNAKPENGVGRSLLFVAHRDEILRQSQQVFQLVLREPGFGERLVGGERPHSGRHVFASVQSLANRVDEIEPDGFDVVIVDEFHHAAAASYERLLSRLKPKILLGLTATPERADGRSVLDWFDGRIARSPGFGMHSTRDCSVRFTISG